MSDKKDSISKIIKDIEDIKEWFDETEELDLEEGFEKAEEGLDLISKAEKKLEEAENKLDNLKEEHLEE